MLVIGQAPGRRVHESGVPWDDQSGDRLRDWMGVDRAWFYDRRHTAIVPMGFRNLTETVRAWKQYRPAYLPMPHPSPRNNRWLKRNPWFLEEVVPYLRRRIRKISSAGNRR